MLIVRTTVDGSMEEKYLTAMQTDMLRRQFGKCERNEFEKKFQYRNITFQLYRVLLYYVSQTHFFLPTFFCWYNFVWYADHLNKGTVPPHHLLDGLREIRYSLNSWVRTKEVGKYSKLSWEGLIKKKRGLKKPYNIKNQTRGLDLWITL